MQRIIESSSVKLALQVREPGDNHWSTLNLISGHNDGNRDYLGQLRQLRDAWAWSHVFSAGATFRIVSA